MFADDNEPKRSYKRSLESSRAWYKKVIFIYCPLLRTNIVFNSKGFYHLVYDGRGKRRSKKEQMIRLELLKKAPHIIATAEFIADHRYQRLGPGKYIEYWELKDEFDRSYKNIAVILKRTGNGSIIFYSIMKKRNKKAVTDE